MITIGLKDANSVICLCQ